MHRAHLTRIRITIALIILGATGCEKSVTPVDDALLLGSWNEIAWEDGAVQVLQRSPRLDGDKYGITFIENGSYIECANGDGLCINGQYVYQRFEGNWLRQKNGRMIIDLPGHWGGRKNYEVEIVDLTEDELRIRYLAIDTTD